MLFYFLIYSFVAIVCVQNCLSGTAVNRPLRSTDTKCYDLAAPGWTVEKLANVTLDLWPWNCLDSKYGDSSLREAISNACPNVHDAASKGYIGFFRYYAEKRKVPINERKEDENGETPLHLAVQNGHLNIVKYIASKLESRELHKNNYDLRSPVMYAASFGRLDILKFLLNEAKADLNTDNDDKKLALRLAAQGGHLSELKYLIDERNYPVNSSDRDLLYAAASGGNVDLIKYLVNEKKLETIFPGKNKCSHNWALHHAASAGSLAAMKFFIDDLGQDVNLRGKNGKTPVHSAAQGGSIQAIKYLIEEKGADVNLRSYSGYSPLHLASGHGHLPVVKYLVDEQHVSVEVKDYMGRTPVHHAAYENKMDVVKFLLDERKAERYGKGKDGRTLLHQAAHSGNVDMMRYLVDDEKMQALIDETDTLQCTAVYGAAFDGHLDTLKFLVDEKHANTTITDLTGDNILRAAARMCNFAIVKYLVVEKGFNVDERNPLGVSAYIYGIRCDHGDGEMEKIKEQLVKNSPN